MNKDICFWTESLWRYFGPQVSAGYPMYFSVDQATLEEIVAYENHTLQEEPLTSLAMACREYLNPMGHRISLKKEVYLPVVGDSSPVICFIALFVAVVEFMDEDKYFPVLRSLLGVEAGENLSRNPFFENEFDSLWTKLKEEIISYPGGDIRCITFKKGKGRKELNRELSLSQALLTGRDLCRLYKNVEELKSITSADQAFSLLREKRNILSSRGAMVIATAINNEDRRVALSRQILSFIQNPRPVVERYIEHEKKLEGIFEAFRSARNLFSREPVKTNVYFSNSLIDVNRAIRNFCEGNKALLLIEEDRRFAQVTSRLSISSGVDCLLITERDAANIHKVSIEKAFESQISFKEIATNLNSEFIAYTFTSETEPFHELNYLAGRFSYGSDKEKNSLSLRGGILIDGRTKKYLAPFSPRALLFNGKELAPEDKLCVNGVVVQYQKFMQDQLNVDSRSDAFFRVNYLEVFLDFEIYQHRTPSGLDTCLGFPFGGKTLFPFIKPIEPGDRALVGFSLPRRRTFFAQSRRKRSEAYSAINLILLNWSSEQAVEISDDQKQLILEKVELFKFVSPVKQIILEKLNSRCIPRVSYRILFPR